MSNLQSIQHEFLNYLLEKPSVIANTIISDDVSADQRLGLYADAYKLRLKEAMMTDYEQLHAYLGDEMFDQLMESYISEYPSNKESLRYFSQKLPEKLKADQPWSQAVELSELAAIEKAFCDSFDAADSQPVTLTMLSQVPLDNWPTLKIKFHNSVQLLSMATNSFQIWKALSENAIPPEVEQDVTHWLIWRNDLVSRYIAITDAEVSAFKVMMVGSCFGDLCESLLEYYDEEQTPQQAVGILQSWISHGMVCELLTD